MKTTDRADPAKNPSAQPSSEAAQALALMDLYRREMNATGEFLAQGQRSAAHSKLILGEAVRRQEQD